MRIVLAASACVEFLLGSALGAKVAASLIAAESIHAPEVLISEVISALRGLLRGGGVSEALPATLLTTDATLAAAASGMGVELVRG